MNRNTMFALAALGAAFAFMASRARASVPQSPSYGNPGDFIGPIYDESEPIVINPNDDDSVMQDPRVRAFLLMIRSLEHSPAAVSAGIDYYTGYGGKRFTSVVDHPVITGELRAVPLPPQMCRDAGFPDGDCTSSAAGGYQTIVPSWNDVRGMSPRLLDFSPANQDRAAVRLLRKDGALTALLQDDIDGAMRKASKRWASLPYSTARQNPKSIETALNRYYGYLEA